MKIYSTLDKNYIKYRKQVIHIIIDHDDNIWFATKEIAKALGYKDLHDAIRVNIHKRDKKQLKYIKSDKKMGHPQTLYTNEAGLYRLMLRSRLKTAEKFVDWITHDVLPSIRKYGIYRLKQDYTNQLHDFLVKINYLEEENKKIKQDLKKEKFPKGGVVYVIDYSTKHENIFRIGMTGNMALRKKLYNTHTLHNHEIVHIVESPCPNRLEACVRVMLYDHRYTNKKDFFECSLATIKKAFKICIESMECIKQKGGSKTSKKINKSPIIEKSLVNAKNSVRRLERKIKSLNKKLMS